MNSLSKPSEEIMLSAVNYIRHLDANKLMTIHQNQSKILIDAIIVGKESASEYTNLRQRNDYNRIGFEIIQRNKNESIQDLWYQCYKATKRKTPTSNTLLMDTLTSFGFMAMFEPTLMRSI